MGDNGSRYQPLARETVTTVSAPNSFFGTEGNALIIQLAMETWASPKIDVPAIPRRDQWIKVYVIGGKNTRPGEMVKSQKDLIDQIQ